MKIINPKRKMIEGVHMGITTSAVKVSGGWNGSIRVPLKNLGWAVSLRRLIEFRFFASLEEEEQESIAIPCSVKA